MITCLHRPKLEEKAQQHFVKTTQGILGTALPGDKVIIKDITHPGQNLFELPPIRQVLQIRFRFDGFLHLFNPHLLYYSIYVAPTGQAQNTFCRALKMSLKFLNLMFKSSVCISHCLLYHAIAHWH